MTAASDRAVRGTSAAVVGVAVAVAAHGAAGGASLVPVALACALVSAAALTAAGGRAWTPVRVLGALVVVQLLVHGALSLAEPSGPVDPRLASLAAASHAHAGHDVALTPSMLLAHGVAVVVAALLLAAVERASVAVRALLARVVVLLSPVVPLLRRVVLTPVTGAVPALPSLDLATAPRRGPPAVCCTS